jgi:hypothetical protein
MGLSELLGAVGHTAHEEPVGSGLRSLVRPEAATVAQPPAIRMNLVQAMNALQRGEIERPPDGDLNGMVVDTELPLLPAPAPEPDWRDDPIYVEAKERAEIDHVEMRRRIAERKGWSLEQTQEWMEAQYA